MEQRERYKRLTIFLAAILIMAIQTLIFAMVWNTYYDNPKVIGTVFWRRGNWAMIAYYAIMLLIFGKLFGAFQVGTQRVVNVLLSQILSNLCVNALMYLLLALVGRWKWMSHFTPIVKMTGMDIVGIIIWVVVARWIYTKIYPPHQMLLIYGDISPGGLVDKLETRKDKYIIAESIHMNCGEEIIHAKIDEYKSVLVGDIPSHTRNQILKYCFSQSIRCYTVPKLSDIMIESAQDIHLFDTPLLLFRNRGLTIEQQIAKRTVDLVCSTIGLVLASPFMLIIALCIKAYDKGPVFYKQERLTKDRKPFMVYKFRSMKVNSEKDGARLAMKGDSRITPVGRVIRNIHFDELPQLINVFRGEMAMVGPRPEREIITREYEEEIPEFSFRLKVKAGLTGYAQVFGKYNTTPYDKLKLDLTYIENYSIGLDLKLILLTVKILFQRENTEGVEKWQTTAATKEHGQKKGRTYP